LRARRPGGLYEVSSPDAKAAARSIRRSVDALVSASDSTGTDLRIGAMTGAHRLREGETFAERYETLGFLGQGAMGSVYRVCDQRTDAVVALKVMNGELASSPDFVDRFLLEAKIGERIASDLVVRVLESGVDAKTKLPYFAMEMLEGEDLHHRLESGPELERADAVRLLRDLYSAMAAAHDAGVVHRDLKPENLFLVRAPDGPPGLKVLDFGVAKLVRETTNSGTAPGLGTPLWAAPEQGSESQQIRASSDVWALGLLTYRLLARRLFWRGANAARANAFDLAVEMLREPIPLASERSRELGAPDLGEAFDRWFERAVHREPAQRFADARAAWAAFEPVLAPPGGRTAASSEAHPARAWLAVTSLALAAIAVALWLWLR
jgi:eukaryotic-like serine/threonine-protein kinase